MRKNLLVITMSFVVGCLLFNCIKAVEPEYDYQDNLLFIDAFALTEPGFSYVSIQESFSVNDAISFRGIEDAEVSFENTEDARIVTLAHDVDGYYRPPAEFNATSGETWKLFVELADGRKYASTPERIPEQVPFSNVQANFKVELAYEESFDDFVAGHAIALDFQDPPNEENFYMWKYRSFERISVCRTCNNGILRNDTCRQEILPPWQPQYYDYLCLGNCWKIRYGTKIPVYSDQFSDGEFVQGREVSDIIFYRKQDILVEIQQYAINESTYRYFKTINDLISESGGLNAPTPTALLGNIVSTEDSEEIILGQFAASAINTSRIFIDRDNLPTTPVDPDRTLQQENCIGCPTHYPCIESRDRISTKPDGWQ